MIFLHSHGVGTSRAVRIFKTYGADAIRLISENPYRLARDIRGIGFKSADQIAWQARHREDGDDPRPRRHRLRAHRSDGRGPLRAAAGGTAADGGQAAGGAGRDHRGRRSIWSCKTARSSPTASTARRCIFLAGLHRAERAIAARIKRSASGALPWPAIDAAKAIPWVETKAGITLAASQREAVQLALATKVLVITGGPGVGKTTLVNSILKILRVKGVRRRAGRTYRPRGETAVGEHRPVRRRRSIGSWRPIPYMAASGGRRITRWNATCSSSTRPR